MKERGIFIVFEGVGGSGKSSQMENAREFLESEGLSVVTTREPGGTEGGESVRELIFKLRSEDLITGEQQLVLFFASRYLLVKNIVMPKINEGAIVISDRLHPSTGAYQGYGEGADMEKILQIAEVVLGEYKPDAIVLFDVDWETSQKRSNKEEDPFDRQGEEYGQRVIEGYREMAKNNWGGIPWYIIDGVRPIDAVSADLNNVLQEVINK